MGVSGSRPLHIASGAADQTEAGEIKHAAHGQQVTHGTKAYTTAPPYSRECSSLDCGALLLNGYARPSIETVVDLSCGQYRTWRCGQRLKKYEKNRMIHSHRFSLSKGALMSSSSPNMNAWTTTVGIVILTICLISGRSHGYGVNELYWQYNTAIHAWDANGWSPQTTPNSISVLVFDEPESPLHYVCFFAQEGDSNWIPSVAQIAATSGSTITLDALDEPAGSSPTLQTALLTASTDSEVNLGSEMWLQAYEVTDGGGEIRVWDAKLDVVGSCQETLKLRAGAEVTIGESLYLAGVNKSLYIAPEAHSLTIDDHLLLANDAVATFWGGTTTVKGILDCDPSNLDLHGDAVLRCGGFLGQNDLNFVFLNGATIEVGAGDFELQQPNSDLYIAAQLRLVHGCQFDLTGTLTIYDGDVPGGGVLRVTSIDLDGVEVTDARSAVSADTILVNGDGAIIIEGYADVDVAADLSLVGGGSISGSLNLSSVGETEGGQNPTLDVGGDLLIGSTGSRVIMDLSAGTVAVEGDMLVGQSVDGDAFASVLIGQNYDDGIDDPNISVSGDLLVGVTPAGLDADAADLNLQSGVLTVEGKLELGVDSTLSVGADSNFIVGRFETANLDAVTVNGGYQQLGVCVLSGGTLAIPHADSQHPATALLTAFLTSIDGSMSIGGTNPEADGTVYVTNYAQPDVSGDLTIGTASGGDGNLIVYSDNTLDVWGGIAIHSTGMLELDSGAAATAGEFTISETGSCELKPGSSFSVSGNVTQQGAGGMLTVGGIAEEAATLVAEGDVALANCSVYSNSLLIAEGELTMPSQATTLISVAYPPQAGGCMQGNTVVLDGHLSAMVYTPVMAGLQIPLMSAESAMTGTLDSFSFDQEFNQPGASISVVQQDGTLLLVVEAATPGDGNLDGRVDYSDLTRLITQSWGRARGGGTGDWSPFFIYNEDDCDQNGIVNVIDLLLLLQNWTG